MFFLKFNQKDVFLSKLAEKKQENQQVLTRLIIK